MIPLDAPPQAGWEELLPARRVALSGVPDGPPRVVDELRLGPRSSLAVVADRDGQTYVAPIVADGGGQRRAVPGDGAAEELVATLRRAPGGGGRTEDGFVLRSWHTGPAVGEHPIPVDQTNESVVVGDAVVKWMAVAEEGPHPAPSLLAKLDRAGFTGMPRPWGSVEWAPAPGAPGRLLALVVEHVRGAVDGWTWVVAELRSAVEEDRAAVAVEAGAVVGRLVAELHRALADTARGATPEEAAGWREDAVADLDRALSVTRGRSAAVLRAHETAVRQVLGAVPAAGGPVLRVHGDLHVGQVLRADGGGVPAYLLTDFDGNPVLPPAARVRPQPAAVDVAGAVQSFTHAGLVLRRHAPELDPAAVDAAAAAARRACLDAYRTGLGQHRGLLDDRLLLPLAVRQVCREFTYAGLHLPRWSYVPEAALPALLEVR